MHNFKHLQNVRKEIEKEKKTGFGINLRSLLDGLLATNNLNLKNYSDRNTLIDIIDNRLSENDWITFTNGTTFEKTFVPSKKES